MVAAADFVAVITSVEAISEAEVIPNTPYHKINSSLKFSTVKNRRFICVFGLKLFSDR